MSPKNSSNASERPEVTEISPSSNNIFNLILGISTTVVTGVLLVVVGLLVGLLVLEELGSNALVGCKVGREMALVVGSRVGSLLGYCEGR